MVTTIGAIRRADLQSNYRHHQTNTQFFYRSDALPVTQPTVSKHWRGNFNQTLLHIRVISSSEVMLSSRSICLCVCKQDIVEKNCGWMDFDDIFLSQWSVGYTVGWHCLLDGGIQPVKTEYWYAEVGELYFWLECSTSLEFWLFCRVHRLLMQHNPEWFAILVLAYSGCPGILSVKQMLFISNDTVYINMSICIISYLLLLVFI